MRIYLISKENNEIIKEFDDVVDFKNNYVLYSQRGNLGKIYAMENEYFSDTIPEIIIEEQPIENSVIDSENVEVEIETETEKP